MTHPGRIVSVSRRKRAEEDDDDEPTYVLTHESMKLSELSMF